MGADRNRSLGWLLAGTFITTSMVFAAPAFAQATGSAAAEPAGVDEVVVTARRRTELVQDVPVAVSAYSGQQLEEAGVQRVSDLTRIAPGLGAQASPFGNGALTLSLRGQRQGLANIAYDPAVPVYFDEVIQARSQGLNAAMFDLESIQVLKGPQGTLFGRNSTGGALLITSKAPTDQFEGYLRGEVGDYNLRHGEGAVNLPLGAGFAARIAASVTRRDGYAQDFNTGYALDDEDTATWRLSLAYKPNDWFSNQMVLNGFYEGDTGVAYKLIYVRPGTANAVPDAAELAFYGTQDFHTTNAYSPRNGTRIETFGFGNVTSWDVNETLTLKNILGYRDISTRLFFDLDGIARPGTQSQETVEDDHWSDELQVLGTAFEEKLTYVAGLYWFRENGHEIQTVEVQGAGLNNTITDNEVTNETLAAYAQGSYKLPWVDGLSLTAGLRYTQDKRELTSRNRFFSGVCRIVDADVSGVPLNPCIKTVEDSFEEPTYTVSLDWKVSPDLLVYLASRRGYQSGGFTNSANRPSEFTPFLPQTVTDWEVGMKSDWSFGGVRGRTNIALYRGEYEDIQRLTSFPASNPSGLPFTQNRILNAATSKIQGLELDFQVRPVESLLATLSYARTDAAYDNYLINGADYSDAPFAGVPEDSVSWMIRWDTPFFQDFAKIALQLDGAWQSWTVVSDATSYDPVSRQVIPLSRLDDYGTANARIDFEEIGGKPLQLSLWVRNLTDEEYYTAGIDSSTTAGVRSVRLMGPPRTIGAEVTLDF